MSVISDAAKDVKNKKAKKQPNDPLPPLAQGEGGLDVRPSPSISSAYVPDQLVPRDLAFSSTLQGTRPSAAHRPPSISVLSSSFIRTMAPE